MRFHESFLLPSHQRLFDRHTLGILDEEKDIECCREVHARQQSESRREAIRLCQRTNDRRGKTADRTARIEDEILRRRARIRRIVFRKQRAVASHHAIAEEAEHRTAEEQEERRPQIDIHIHHSCRAHVEEQVRFLTAETVREITEDINACDHTDDRDNHPSGHRLCRKAVLLQKDHRQPDHDAVIAEILHTRHDGERNRGHRLRRAGEQMRQRELACFRELRLLFRRQRFASRLSFLQLLLQLFTLQPHRWFLQAMARPCRQQRRNDAHEEEASPAVIRKNDSRQDRSEYSPRLPAHRHARRSTRASLPARSP